MHWKSGILIPQLFGDNEGKKVDRTAETFFDFFLAATPNVDKWTAKIRVWKRPDIYTLFAPACGQIFFL